MNIHINSPYSSFLLIIVILLIGFYSSHSENKITQFNINSIEGLIHAEFGKNFDYYFSHYFGQEQRETVQVYRTIMPDAGPSAFAIHFPRVGLSLCYDPVRGGVNYVWLGKFDLSPTLAKVHDLVKIEGKPFYRETEWYPLRLTDSNESGTDYSFRGYKVQDGVLEIQYIINGDISVREKITPIEGYGIRRDFEVESRVESLSLLIEPQDKATVEVEGGDIQDNGWVEFRGEPLRSFGVTIVRKQEER